jgi:hypothetical protein
LQEREKEHDEAAVQNADVVVSRFSATSSFSVLGNILFADANLSNLVADDHPALPCPRNLRSVRPKLKILEVVTYMASADEV